MKDNSDKERTPEQLRTHQKLVAEIATLRAAKRAIDEGTYTGTPEKRELVLRNFAKIEKWLNDSKK